MNHKPILVILAIIVIVTSGCLENNVTSNDLQETIIQDKNVENLHEKSESVQETSDLKIQETSPPIQVEETYVDPKNEIKSTLEEVTIAEEDVKQEPVDKEDPTTIEDNKQEITLEGSIQSTIDETQKITENVDPLSTTLPKELVEDITGPVIEKNATLEVMVYRCGDDYSLQCDDSSGYSIREKREINRYIIHPEKLQLSVPIDGIPSIDEPQFVSVGKADDWIEDNELVLAIIYKGIKRVYPLQIMIWHEIVNDNIAGDPVLITYCPLCGSGIAFNRTINGQVAKFGVSGALYNSNLVMYDKKTKSYWTQMDGLAIIGELSGTKLIPISIDTVVWRDWKKIHPDSEVLSQDTGYYRQYGRDIYGSYYENSYLFYPVENEDNTIHPKTIIFGIEVDGFHKAYREDDLKERGVIADTINGVDIRVERDEAGVVKITNLETGEEIVKERDFWFAWYAFHPRTLLYTR